MATSPAAPSVADWPDRSVPPSRAYLASQVWTAERVRRELLRDVLPWPRYEFIDGELLVSHAGDEVSPSPTRRHQRAVVALWQLLAPYVARHRLGEVLTSPLDVSLGSDEVRQPDVLVVPPDDAEGSVSDEPVTRLTLAVEVLSPSTARDDRVKKRASYTRRGVPEYWVVDCDARLIEVTRSDEPSRVEPVDGELRWHPAGAPAPLVIDVADYFAGVGGRGR